MARMQPRMQGGSERMDGLKEKMVSVNRVTKVVKGGRILGFAALTVVAKARRARCRWPCRRRSKRRAAGCSA